MCSKLLCQDKILVNILLFEDSLKIKKYPYGEFNRDEERIGFQAIPAYPEEYAEYMNKTYSKYEYIDILQNTVLPPDLWATIRFRIEWDGGVSEASLISYKGDKPNLELLKNIASNIRFKPPINEKGVPYPLSIYMGIIIKGKNWLLNNK